MPSADSAPTDEPTNSSTPAPTKKRKRAPLALSPSRCGDYLQCPLLFRFRALDRLPEPNRRPSKRHPGARRARGNA